MFRWLTGSLCALTAMQALAATGVVEGVQMPAWIERGGQQMPLRVGNKLAASDQLHTGLNARILLRLDEGSTVKLGESGSLRLDEAGSDKGIFSAALAVVKGAFRFTTAQIMKHRRRDVAVQIGSATVGIRGTDVWGKAADDKDIVCLLEGKISVNRGSEEPLVMQEPLTFYVAPKGQPAQSVAPVPPEQIEKWARETEIQAQQGAARLGGKWKLYLLSTTSEAEVLQAYDTLEKSGYAVEIRPVGGKPDLEYRLRIVNLPSRNEAEALAKILQAQAGVGKTRVSIR